MVRLEHANLCVGDVNAMLRFLQTAFPEFRVRAKGTNNNGTKWLHVGTDDTYLTLNSGNGQPPPERELYSAVPGWNHLGYEVDDVTALRERMLAAGYEESTPPNNHPHRKRVYFYDPEGNDWEFVQYFSDDPAERNDYDLPDV